MLKVKVLTVGKTKEKWLEDALKEYEKRLSSTVIIEWVIVKNDAKLLACCEKEKNYLCLDPLGVQLDSVEWSSKLTSLFDDQGGSITFVIGGAEGLPKEVAKNAKKAISLSRLTFTHQITRLILIEQIYRGFEIQKGTRYHK